MHGEAEEGPIEEEQGMPELFGGQQEGGADLLHRLLHHSHRVAHQRLPHVQMRAIILKI